MTCAFVDISYVLLNVFVGISYDLLSVFVPMSCVLLIYPGLHAFTPFLPTPICPYYPPRHNIRQINPNAYVQNHFATHQRECCFQADHFSVIFGQLLSLAASFP